MSHHWLHHSPGTVSGDGERVKGVFEIGEPYKYFSFLTKLHGEPIPTFQAPHSFLNYNDIEELALGDFGPDARLGPHDIYIPFVDRGKLVGTVTGKLSSHVAETPIRGTVTSSLS
ncbi:hypothetical protein APHAL10511_003542 [Amanita phalloides]|nr:hypothetical protein APHAL10511_003542 [Amanita phalloides]